MELRDTKSILLVEDNDAHAFLIRHYVQAQTPIDRLEHVQNGEEALVYFFRCCSRPGGCPDLILLDLRLPRVNGLEVLKAIKTSGAIEIHPGRDSDNVRARVRPVHGLCLGCR